MESFKIGSGTETSLAQRVSPFRVQDKRLGGNYAKPRQHFAWAILEYGKQCYAIPVSVCACLHQPDQVLFAPV